MALFSFFNNFLKLQIRLVSLTSTNYFFIFCIGIGLMVASCKPNEPDTPAESPNTLSIVSGDFQIGYQNTDLPNDIEVKLTDGSGNAVANKTLKAEIIKGDGSVADDEVATNASGIAIFTWKLGEEAYNNLRISELEFPTNSVDLSARSKYKYTIPVSDNDGWPTLSIDSVMNNKDLALEAVDKVRWGNYSEIHSIVLAVDGKLVLDTYFPGTNSFGQFIEFDRFTPHELHSSSKTFRSALIGIAIEKGYLSGEDATMASIFPELSYLSQGGKENILLEHILTMSSGLEWDEASPAPNSLSEMYNLPSYNDWYDYVLSKPLVADPGSTFVYNTGASLVLNKILVEHAEPALFPFVETNYTDLVESDEEFGGGFPLASEARPREMAKLGQIYVNDGKWKNTQVISPAWIQKSITPALTVSSTYDYGYQWWLRDIETSNHTYSSYSAIGFGGQYIIVIKELDLVAVFTGGNFQTEDKVMEIMSNYILPAFE